MLFKLFLERYIKNIIIRLFMVIKLSKKYPRVRFENAPNMKKKGIKGIFGERWWREWFKKEFEKLGWGKWPEKD